MKRTKRRVKVAALVAVVAITTTFAACGAKSTDKDEQGRTVISVGSYPTSEGSARDNWNTRWKEFEANNTDIKIIPDMWTFDLKTFYAKAAGNQLPNLFVTHYTEIGQCMEAGYVANLTDVLKKRGYEGKFNKKVLDIVTDEKGDIYAFPTTSYALGIAYNTNMFEKAGLMEADGTPKQPKDWEELREFAQKIKEATGKSGFALPTSANSGGWLFSCIAWSFGTEFMKQDDSGKWIATFNTPEAAEALQWVKDLKWKYDVLPANTIIDYGEYYKLYATENTGMVMAAGSIPATLAKYNMDPEKIGMLAMPAGPKRHVTLMGGALYSVSKNSTDDQIEAAVRWLEDSCNFKVTDEFKENKEREIKLALEANQLVGIKSLKTWSSDSESVKFEYDLINKNANVNLNHVKLYNDFISKPNIEIQPEEPVCAQELYGVLDGCIQEVLTNKDANCATVLKKANSDFQENYLDNLDY